MKRLLHCIAITSRRVDGSKSISQQEMSFDLIDVCFLPPTKMGLVIELNLLVAFLLKSTLRCIDIAAVDLTHIVIICCRCK